MGLWDSRGKKVSEKKKEKYVGLGTIRRERVDEERRKS